MTYIPPRDVLNRFFTEEAADVSRQEEIIGPSSSTKVILAPMRGGTGLFLRLNDDQNDGTVNLTLHDSREKALENEDELLRINAGWLCRDYDPQRGHDALDRMSVSVPTFKGLDPRLLNSGVAFTLAAQYCEFVRASEYEGGYHWLRFGSESQSGRFEVAVGT